MVTGIKSNYMNLANRCVRKRREVNFMYPKLKMMYKNRRYFIRNKICHFIRDFNLSKVTWINKRVLVEHFNKHKYEFHGVRYLMDYVNISQQFIKYIPLNGNGVELSYEGRNKLRVRYNGLVIVFIIDTDYKIKLITFYKSKYQL